MPTKIQVRRGTAAQWTTANPILASGEPGLETDTRKRKMGNGSTAWNLLDYDLTTDALDDLFDPAGAATTALATALLKASNLSDLSNVATARTNLALGNVNNTADSAKPISTAVQSALDLKSTLLDPHFSGVPTAPTPTLGTNTTQLANTAFVAASIAALIASAPGALDTLDELAASLGDDANFAATVVAALAGKLAKASNLSDLTDLVVARSNLGLGSAATQSSLAFTDFFDDSLVASGETTLPRYLMNASATLASTSMRLGYFTARKTETINTLGISTGATAAGATPSIARMGIYSLDGSGNGTLAASTPNDTSLFAGATTRYTKGLSAPFSKVAGTRYAVSILVVSGATMPNMAGWAAIAGYALFGMTPRITGLIASQSDLPSSFTAGQVVASGSVPLFELIP